MKRLFIIVTSVIAITRAAATGYYGSTAYLAEGGKNVDASPEFYWDLELKRIAREFQVPEKRVRSEGISQQEETATMDRSEFEDALRHDEIKPSDVEEARKANNAAREAILSLGSPLARGLPLGFDSEFSDYHRGAFAYRQGREHFDEAREAWLTLLKRPPEERHYRTVWAAFMLGKLALKADIAQAAKWFQQTREFAKQGFADSLGCAADSYGWEGRAELKQEHPEEAAKLFLTQLSLGDESAVVSIKALIPDRRPIPGLLNYNIVESTNPDDIYEPKKSLTDEQELAGLQRAAKDPLLRRLVTAHILATGSTRIYFSEESNAAQARARRWLEAIKSADLSHVKDAEYLGWIAYTRGDYKDAARWLDLAVANTPAALWLKAKLARRNGNLAEAIKAMTEAWQTLRDEHAYVGWTGESRVAEYLNSTDELGFVFRAEVPSWTISQQASGDFAAFKLQRTDFVQAFDILVKNDVWDDAAYVGERVLTTVELKDYVDRFAATFASPAPTVAPLYFGWQSQMPAAAKLRYLLGRRLVREDRYEDAMPYLFPPFDQVLRRYADALRAGAKESLPKEERASAWFRAAWIARYNGMEIMGTEMAPDGFIEEGAFPVPDLAKQRISGKVESSDDPPKVVPAVLKATRQEIQRLTATKPSPDIRFHYRVIAAALAIKAAAFLPDNSEETADVINMAGRWVKERDKKLADKYFDLLRKRAAKTSIGRAALERRWFVETKGPWSTRFEAEEQQFKKQLGLHDPDEKEPQPQQTQVDKVGE